MMQRRRVVHVVYSFGHGGLENVIVQLINRLPADRFEHVLVSLTTIGAFRDRIERDDVQFIELNKPPGHAVPLYPRIWRVLRGLHADVLHTCNLAALEIVPLGWLAGIPVRVHAEHGWDVHDPHGRNVRYQRLRRLYRAFVSQYVAVSSEMDTYLVRHVKVPATRRSLIINGVDTERFAPAEGVAPAVPGCPFDPAIHWLIGTVGRMQTVKNQPLLARAFVELLRREPDRASHVRLVMVGDGPLQSEVESILEQAGVRHLAWLPGMRDDVADVLRMLDCFVLPSQTEGTSCTLQEAMACGLGVIATEVGGNAELLEKGRCGALVPPDHVDAMAEAMRKALIEPDSAHAMGRRARERMLQWASVDAMVKRYAALFETGTHV
jgi:sugar transferase (PEP-CTERM/EpsH1 system associated)